MNKLLEHYMTSVEFPEVSGLEHLEMLQIRDKLFELEATLSDGEKEALNKADRRLVERVAEFHKGLSRFINFEQRRQAQQIPATHWWWYLDVLAQLPELYPLAVEQPLATVNS
jgi:hypothetical protein